MGFPLFLRFEIENKVMVTVTINKIDNVDVTNDIRCLTSDMIVNGSVRPSTVNTAGSACILSVLVWDGNILNYRAEEWLLTDTYTSIVTSFNLVSVTLAKVDGATVTADLRGFDPKMMVAGSMRPLTANNTATAAVFRVLTWDNNNFTQKAVEWQVTSTYAALKTAIEAAERAANQYAPPYAAATGTDTYALTLVPAISAYVTGVPFHFSVANTNTGASTLNVNSLGAKVLVKGASTALAAGDLEVGKIYQGVYDGAEIQVSELPASSGGGDGFTEVTVALAELAIESAGTTPITLLAAPGAGKYHEWQVILKKPAGSSVAEGAVDYWWIGDTALACGTYIQPTAFNGADEKVVMASSYNSLPISAFGVNSSYTVITNTSVVFTTNSGADPTSATGAMSAIVRYKERTF